MRYEFAPMEGITGYIYRNAHHAFFPSVDRYYTPFITPKQGKSFTTREWNDVIREHNAGIEVIPQILTNQADGFCMVADKLKELGYEEVNLAPVFWHILMNWIVFWKRFLKDAVWRFP